MLTATELRQITEDRIAKQKEKEQEILKVLKSRIDDNTATSFCRESASRGNSNESMSTNMLFSYDSEYSNLFYFHLKFRVAKEYFEPLGYKVEIDDRDKINLSW